MVGWSPRGVVWGISGLGSRRALAEAGLAGLAEAEEGEGGGLQGEGLALEQTRRQQGHPEPSTLL